MNRSTPVASPFTWHDRLRYRADTALATGAVWWVIVWIGLVMLGFLVATAAIIGSTGLEDVDGEEFGYLEGFWQALLRALDPGTMAGDGAWPLRLTSLVVTLTGVLLVSTLIGITATGISSRLSEIRRGRVPMAEAGHTLVLGWSSKVQTLVSQIAEGHPDDDGTCVVVLAEHDKGEMDDEIRAWLRDAPDLRVLTRTGSPHRAADMRIVNPQLARSIVVLRNGAIDGDARVVKTVLALLHDLEIPAEIPIIAEMGSRAAATSLRGVVNDQVIVLEPGNVIGRVIAQACRHPGVDQVLTELFSYQGSELYEILVPEVAGLTFGDALLSFDDSVPIGLITEDDEVIVRPSAGQVVGPRDRLVMIAVDVDSIVFSGTRQIEPPTVDTTAGRPSDEPERALMFGFNEFAPTVIAELDDYVPAGSSLRIIADPDLTRDIDADLPSGLQRMSVEVESARLGQGVVAELLARHKPDYVIVLCYRGELTPADADARTLVTFLEAGRAITEGGLTTNVVAELLDPADVHLVPADWSNEFIITEHLTSLFITQVAENRRLAPVFDDLLDAEGSEIYCKPVARYGAVGASMTFAELTASATARDEIAIGYRRGVGSHSIGSQVLINPSKLDVFELQPEDALVVLADDEQ